MFDTGVYAHKARLFRHLECGNINTEVVHELLPNGVGLLYEKALWDYKVGLPTLPLDRNPSEGEKAVHAAKMAEIVKDVVSFYNSYGGYIVAGIDDRTKITIGFQNHFSIEDLQKKSFAATGHHIDCHYSICNIESQGASKTVGILLVPRRPYTLPPAQFRRNAPKHPANESMAYREGDIYLRVEDECRPARTAEDFTFLCGDARREVSIAEEFRRVTVLLNNLGPKDPGFIKFVGREAYLRELWRWVCEGFTPVKLLTGIGGVGKTTLAREFSEDFIRNPPKGFTKLIWLSAKRQLYTAIQGEFQATTRVDFSDIGTLLRAILMELGTPKELIDPEQTIPELVEECISALQLFPSLMIIDDVDSLDPTQQQELFQTMVQITTRTVGRGSSPSVGLLTSRLDLGAAPRQLLHIAGLEEGDFLEYCKMAAGSLSVPFTLKRDSQLLRRFHKTTDGSPTFAASILRLMANGQSLDVVLREWEGSDGETVRRFAFGNELDQLSDSQIRTLYAACLLGETSFIELQRMLDSNDRLLNDDLGALRKYHLIALGEDLPGGAKIIIPSSLTLVTDLIAKRVADPRRLARLCARAQRGTTYASPEVGEAIRRVAALWREGKPDDALQSAEVAIGRFPDHPDLECVLGRAHLQTIPPDAVRAEFHLKKAHALKCARPELQDLWIKAKVVREDWVGLVDGSAMFAESPAIIIARTSAFLELGMIAVRSRNIDRAVMQWRSGFKEVSQALSGWRLRGREQEGRKLQRSLIENVVRATDTVTINGNEKLEVWMAGMEATNVGVRAPDVIAITCNSLLTWWSAVEARRRYDKRAHEVLQDQIKRLERIIARDIYDKSFEERSLQQMRAAAEELSTRSKSYGEEDYSSDQQ